MQNILHLAARAGLQTWNSFTSNVVFLMLSIFIATILRFSLDADKVSVWLRRHARWGILGATAVAVATPLCSCGTMAVVLGLLASRVPWAPIVAFMTASPLTSPQELVYSAGLFGWPFALAFFAASIGLGILAGSAAAVLDIRGFLAHQSRWDENQEEKDEASTAPADRRCPCLFKELCRNAARLLSLFFGFAFLGYFLNAMIPPGWISAFFGRKTLHGVFAAASLGLPLYINSESALPLVRTMVEAGMSPGAALAFLIAGAGTSLGAIAGALVVARKRVIGLVILCLWLGAIASGLLFNLMS